ncbi:MAG: diaminopimelate decarboxylase [Chitinophagales bacterium]|nr:diaminopimelate decarboxylase [Bacteroidota bacterium]MCB9256236.1 diaminopimelate decarboxylase [Chitinophagales bacterium]
MTPIEVKDNKSYFANLPIEELASKYGTPTYLYDAAIIEKKYKQLREAFKVKINIKYAAKALSNISVLKFMKKLGAGLDTVSIQEVELGLQAGFSPEEIIYTPNCVSIEEVSAAVDKGVIINIDNIPLLEQFGHKYGSSVPVCIRINPHIMAGGNYEISTGHIDSKFGISIHQMRHVQRVIQHTKLDVKGLHMHTGSDILDVDVFLRGAEILFEIAEDFPDLNFIDLGSGFKVSYWNDDNTTDVAELGKKLSERFKVFCSSYGRDLELFFEPGKYLVSEAGLFIAKANVVKQTTATVFVGLDTGMNHLLRPKLYNAHHEVSNVSYPQGIERIYSVVGYICESDTLAADRKLNEVNEGDLIAFHNAGAYGMSMASNYNSRFRPAEVLIYKGKDYLIRKREDMEDITRNMIAVDL